MAEVSVRRTADGVWYCRPYLGTNPTTGRAIRPYRQFPEARDEAEALAMAREWADGLRSRDLGAVLAADRDHRAALRPRRGGGAHAADAALARCEARPALAGRRPQRRGLQPLAANPPEGECAGRAFPRFARPPRGFASIYPRGGGALRPHPQIKTAPAPGEMGPPPQKLRVFEDFD